MIPNCAVYLVEEAVLPLVTVLLAVGEAVVLPIADVMTLLGAAAAALLMADVVVVVQVAVVLLMVGVVVLLVAIAVVVQQLKPQRKSMPPVVS